ncbi:hypothetical protein SAMN05421642_108183 [Rhodococcoides kyotonense]|uniref:Uncharacterized protein n=1 Tax=Rhodococcoides kyotonense TaxID=398843 RepID=A0A239JEX1_9NOCA|nr:hypothetical protein SAMN05421642_108183 [Rhodococcus kyotonensis]
MSDRMSPSLTQSDRMPPSLTPERPKVQVTEGDIRSRNGSTTPKTSAPAAGVVE